MSDSRQPQSVALEKSFADNEDPRIVAAVKEYLLALEADRPPARQKFLARHAEIAGELGVCLDGLDFVHGVALTLRPDLRPRDTGFSSEPIQLPLGDFRILREIGRGGMGIVYEAMQLSLGRRVAVKVLPFAASLDATRLQRFKNEAQAAAQLHHTNIVPVYAVGCERGVHFYAMQLIEGHALSVLIEHLRQSTGKAASSSDSEAGTRLAPDATAPYVAPRSTPACEIDTNPPGSTVLTADHAHPQRYFRTVAGLIQQAATALEHAHRFGVIHRDIKPANLLLDAHNNIWVTDFGLAHYHADAQLTRTGDMLGTLRYMSPEQIAGDRMVLDHRTDIYSLGVTLYELLTLEPVFEGTDRHGLLRRILEDEPRSLRSYERNIPVELETIVLKAMAKVPDERYVNAKQLADDLQRWLEDKPILARRPTLLERAARWRRRHRAVVRSALVFMFLAGLGLIGGTIVIAREHSKTKAAYRREIEQRSSAEESFRQARRAVDSFTQLGEEELANRPQMHQLRRKFLETALDYYRNFLEQRHDDPSIRAELAATSERVAQIIDELSVLEGFAPLMLLSDARVLDELAVTPAEREQIDELMLLLSAESGLAEADVSEQKPQARQKQLAEVLRGYQEQLLALLSPQQMRRLKQIAWQQRGPFAFRSSEIVAALNLTAAQRDQVSTITEKEAPARRGGPGQRPGKFGPPPGGPGEPPGWGPGPHKFHHHDDEPDHHRPGSRPPKPQAAGPADDDDDSRPGKPPVSEVRAKPEMPKKPIPGGTDTASCDPAGSNSAGSDSGPNNSDGNEPGGARSMREVMNRTVARIVAEVLTPAQRAAWKDLTGKPFAPDLHWGPDGWLPH